jgi:hypothetical protein
VIWKGWGGLVCYGPTFPFLCVSRGHALEPCAYSANNKVGENYYAQRKKIRAQGKLNPRPQLWYHARRHLLYLSNYKTQVIWKGRGGLLCYGRTLSVCFVQLSFALYINKIPQQGSPLLCISFQKKLLTPAGLEGRTASQCNICCILVLHVFFITCLGMHLSLFC